MGVEAATSACEESQLESNTLPRTAEDDWAMPGISSFELSNRSVLK
jgi:hypothetical protein